MHVDAFDWTRDYFTSWRGNDTEPIKVLEFGSLDINGSIRSIFEGHCALYVGVDIAPGPGVDVVHDAKSFSCPERFDVVVACEVFEHTPEWREIITNAFNLLNDGGLFLATMAGEGRPPHSAIDANPIRDWEYYANVGAWELNRHLKSLFADSRVNVHGTDLRCWAIKTYSKWRLL